MVPQIPPPTLKEMVGGWSGGVKLVLGSLALAALGYVFLVLFMAAGPP